ncbi:MAG: glycosyltransferase [Magnetococcales bacterium]|nr:glycosyltransferase [Magnetococcales bacterium]
MAYVAPVDLPSPRAHAVQVMKNAQAWAKASETFELIANLSPARWGALDLRRLADYYGLSHPFPIVAYPLYPLENSSRRAWRGLFYRLAAWRCARQRVELVYTRSSLLPGFALAHGLPVLAELHAPPAEGKMDQQEFLDAARHPLFRGIVTISQPLADRYEAVGVPREKLLVLPDGVDLERFAAPLSREAARSALGLPQSGTLAVYAGHLYEGRGVETILAAASRLPEVAFLFAGGLTGDVARWRQKAGGLANVQFTGYLENHRIPPYLWAADLLLMPYGRGCPTVEWMSPLKMFEYMAAERPIVGTDLAAVRWVLRPGESAWLVPPDDGEALVEGIRRVAGDGALGERLATQARLDVEEYCWDRRVERMKAYLAAPSPSE